MKYKYHKIHRRKFRYFPAFMAVVLVTAFCCVIISPLTATVANSQVVFPQSQIIQSVTQKNSSLQLGKELYTEGKFAEAIKVLQQVVTKYRSQGNKLGEAVGLSNLALAYQKLGQLNDAQQVISESVRLLEKSSGAENLRVLAPILDIQGSIQLDVGQPQKALETWQRGEKIYKQLNDKSGGTTNRINQAQAWQVLGFYRRGLHILTALEQELQSQPDSLVKTVELRSLGDALQVAGDLNQSRQVLQQSLDIARKLKSTENIGAALFSLGNTARVEGDYKNAIAFYQQAAAVSGNPITQVQAQINQVSLLVNTGQRDAARVLIPQIQAKLEKLPASQASIYARLNLIPSLQKLGIKPEIIAKISVTAIQQAQDLADKRAESFALGTLGHVYETTQQLTDARKLTQQALNIAQVLNAPDISYRWYWQLGRLLKQQGDTKGAIAAYDNAVAQLQTLRSDLVAVNRDVQYSFKESVEPVYRESVALLLQQQQQNPQEETLNQARQRIEALQLAELDNYFRQACIDAQTVVLDKVVDRDNPTAAIIYPIILPDQLQVIVKIPQQPLRNYRISKSQSEVETVLLQLRESLLEPDMTEEVKQLSQQVYGWLIENIEADLSKSKVNTLVFVLDGALRNIPMAVLYDGQKYLVEKYAVSLSLGLQLLAPKPITQTQLRVLAAGLVEPPPEFSTFASLPGITSEFYLINQAGISTKQLLNKEFTSTSLEQNVNSTPFNILHLATHGQFSSQPENTFILAADGAINVTELDRLLRSRDRNSPETLEMLVLSACQTALGDNRATLGLAGTSVKAGARSTVASLWHISDRSTAILMGEFYRELATNQTTKAEALRRAQVKLLKDYPNFSRPGFWSPYVLVGNWL